MLGYDFQRSIDRYDISLCRDDRLAGLEGRNGCRAEPQRRRDHGVSGERSGARSGARRLCHGGGAAEDPSDDFRGLATQWFIVSDLGLTAYSGNDGMHAFVHSLEMAAGSNAVEVRLISRANEVLATKRTNAHGYVQFEAALTRGEGSASPAIVVATDANGDYAFLSLSRRPSTSAIAA